MMPAAPTTPTWRRSRLPLGIFGAAVLLCLTTAAMAAPLPAEDGAAAASDPNTLGWMTGFPPAPEHRIGQPYTDFWSFPKIRWSVCHLRELLPTRNVSRGLGVARTFPTESSPGLAHIEVPVGPPATGLSDRADAPGVATQNLETFLTEHYTDGFIVLHRGVVVYEFYDGCLDRQRQHATMSMTKSVTGLVAEILIAEGQLDDTLPVTQWVPELKATAFAGATLRQVLDMTTGVAFDETYSDPNSDIWVYARASDAMPKPPGYEGPIGFLDFLLTLKRNDAVHGERFKYGTINTDVLGWVISRSTGKSLADLVADRLWQPMGAELDAYFKNDAMGVVHAGGGLNAGLRDLARVGQLLLDSGRVDEQQVIPKAAVEAIMFGRSKAVSTGARYAEFWPGYRSMWWYGGQEGRPVVAARGVYGQTIYIDPVAELVMVRLSSAPQASNGVIDPRVQPAYRAIADYLHTLSD